jgi:TonB family protein
MSTDKNQTPRAEMRDEEYESTILDFLDKEIAAAQPVQNQEDQSEDVDALVSDLMRQVITESFQLEELPEASVPPQQSETVLDTAPETQDQTRPVQAADAAVPEKTEPPGPVGKSVGVPAPVLLKPRARPRRIIPVIAFASLCLLASIGVVIHYSGWGTKVPAAQNSPATPAAPMQAAAVTRTIPQTAAPVAPAQEIPAPVSNQPQAEPSSIKPQQPETKQASVEKLTGPAKKPEVPVANRSQEPKTGQVEKPRPENPPGPTAVAGAAPVAPATVERTPAPAPAPPETSSLTNAIADRTLEKPLAPIPSQVESFSSAVAPAGSNARQVIAAVPISQTSPSFPELAVRTRASGSVVLDLDIDAGGKVVKVTPVSGPTIFYSAAIAAAMKWRYKPASINGNSIKSQSRVTMVFNLKK